MAELMLVNPRKRRRKSRSKSVARPRVRARRRIRVRSNPIKVARKRYRRNPAKLGSAKGIIQTAIDGFVGAGGAIATDMIVNNLPLPAAMTEGWMKDVTRMGTAIALGVLMEKGLKQRKIGRGMVEGAFVVIAHDIVTKNMGSQLGLAGHGDYYDQLGAYLGPNLGAYESAGMLVPHDTVM